MFTFMKTSLVITFTLACLSIPLLCLAQPMWKQVAVTNLGDRVMVDQNSTRVVKQGRLRRVNFIVQTLYSSPDTDGTVKTAAKYSADCLTNSLGTQWFNKYDSSNKILDEYNSWSGFTPVQPGSVGEILYEYGCQNLR
jgi:hypothetical protein